MHSKGYRIWMMTAAAMVFVMAAQAEEVAAPVVKAIEIHGCLTLTPAQVKANMGTREGQPLNNKRLDEDFQRLNRMDAIADAQIKKEEVEGGLKLTVVIREKNVIRRIQFKGNRDVRKSQLEKLVQTKAGARYDVGQVNRDVRAIQDHYKEEYYYFANVEPKFEPFEDGVRLIFQIEEGGRMYVDDIVLRGNNAFSKKELLKYMETRPSTFFTRGKYDRHTFEKDRERLRMFYQSKGYLDVKVTERPFQIATGKSSWRGGKRSEATIYIDIEEGALYHVGRVQFDGNKLVETDRLREMLETTPGDVFSPITAQKDANAIRDEYGKFPSSRYFTKVWAERVYTEKGSVVDVTFHVKEGEEVVVEDVQILGLTKTKDYVARRMIDQLPGEKIDSVKINQSKGNLHNQGYYKSVSFDVKPGSDPKNRAKVVVDVEEQSTGKLVLGAGVSTQESFIGSVQLQQRNFDIRDRPQSLKDFFLGKAFCGGGQNLDINIAAGQKSENYSIDFTEPWMFGKPLSFGFGLFYKTYEWDRYDEQRMGASLRLGKRLFNNRHITGSMAYRVEEVTLEDFDDDTSDELKKEEGSNWISRMVFNLKYDSRNSRFDPTQGLLLSATQEFAGSVLGGDKDFWRSFGEVNILHPIWKDKSGRPWVLALRADVGMTEAFGDDEHVPVYEKMYLGGIGSVRAFQYHSISPRDDHGDEIGGELKNSYSAEFFVPLYENIVRMSAFYDIGAVWAQLDEMDGDPWRSSCGLGLHVKTPLGPVPIRLYWTHALDEVDGDETESFQFTFGAFF